MEFTWMLNGKIALIPNNKIKNSKKRGCLKRAASFFLSNHDLLDSHDYMILHHVLFS
jgi:hypothetical protein